MNLFDNNIILSKIIFKGEISKIYIPCDIMVPKTEGNITSIFDGEKEIKTTIFIKIIKCNEGTNIFISAVYVDNDEEKTDNPRLISQIGDYSLPVCVSTKNALKGFWIDVERGFAEDADVEIEMYML